MHPGGCSYYINAPNILSIFESIMSCSLSLSCAVNFSRCLPGWLRVGNGCFQLYFDMYRTWENAEGVCTYLGASLATLKGKSTLEGLQQLLAEQGQSTTPIFVGARRRLVWLWFDNSHVTSDMWGPREPSGNGQCGSIAHESHWKDWALNDVPCSTRLGYICQIPAGK